MAAGGIRLNKGELHQFVEKKLVSNLCMGGIRVNKGEIIFLFKYV